MPMAAPASNARITFVWLLSFFSSSMVFIFFVKVLINIEQEIKTNKGQ